MVRFTGSWAIVFDVGLLVDGLGFFARWILGLHNMYDSLDMVLRCPEREKAKKGNP